MKAFAAIDLKGRQVVQWVGGDPNQQRIQEPDPLGVAKRWRDEGFVDLHVIDLDGALGQGNQRDLLRALGQIEGMSVQVGGGLRSLESCTEVLEAGADRVIVGTRAIEDWEFLVRLSGLYPSRVVVALDERDERVATHGWTQSSELEVSTWIDRLSQLPLAGLLITDVGREGRLGGVDADKYQGFVTRSSIPIQAAGGISSIGDIEALKRAGVDGVVIGMALYTGELRPEQILKAANQSRGMTLGGEA